MPRQSGYTKVELLVVLAALVALSAMLFVMQGEGRRESQRARDGERLGEIHQAMIVFAQENRNLYPIPGLIRRHRWDLNLQALPEGAKFPHHIPTSSREDLSQNTTANLYSYLIMYEYVPSDLPHSPRERNPNVKPIAHYNYAGYDPAKWILWDESFKADLEVESHASYAHLLMYGARKRLRWRHTNDSSTPILSNRGPRNGLPDAKSFTTRPDGSWAGFIVFADNSVQWSETVTPENVRYEPNDLRDPRRPPGPDNIFAAEFHDGWPDAPLGSNDAYLTFTLDMGANGRRPTVQHD